MREPYYKCKGWYEHYKCGCVSAVVKYKRQLLGYCPKHGQSRRRLYHEFAVVKHG
jgi:hypothetical protein